MMVRSAGLAFIPALALVASAQTPLTQYLFGKTDLAVAKGPVAFATGDFNGDGIPDFVVANSDSSSYSMILNNGDGSFAPRIDYPLSSAPRRIISADLDGDGKLDVAIAVAGSILVLLGKGDGTFSAPMPYGSVTADGLAAGDFNGDGKLDIAAPEACLPATGRCTDTQGRVQILLGNGDGSFLTGGFFPVIAAPFPAATADFDGDGKLDLAVGSQSNGVSILLGNGDGTFQPRKDFSGAVNALVAGDFNGDGKADLALGGVDRTVAVYLGAGDGTFRPPASYATSIVGLLTALTAADFDGNGTLDLVACGNQQISVFLGNGDGSFQSRSDYYAPGYAWFLGVADYNGDGKADLAVVNRTTTNTNGPDTVSVIINRGDGTFNGRKNIAVGREPRSLVAGNFSGNGQTGLLVANRTDGSISVLEGNGNGSFTLVNSIGSLPGVGFLGIFHPKWNAAGTSSQSKNSLRNATLSRSPDGGKFGYTKGDQLFALSWIRTFAPASTPATRGLELVLLEKIIGNQASDPDYDGDGNSDLAVTIPLAQTIAVILCNGDGTCKKPVEYDAGRQPVAITHADFNGDGKTDLIVADTAANTVIVFLNKGDGTFRNSGSFPTGRTPSWLAVGDFNGDGKDDVAVAASGDNAVSVLLGNGDGTFGARADYPVALSPYAVITADFNGDGKLDLALSNSGSGTIAVLLGNGDGTFQPRQTLVAGGRALELIAADFDGDGRLDLAVANSGDNTISVFLNPTIAPGTR